MTILGPTATAVVEVTGADRVDYLENVTSQRLVDAVAGEVRGAMYLDPHGSPIAVFDVVVLADRLLLLVPDGELADRVVEVLGGRTFLSDARFVRREDAVVALRGDGADELLDAAGLGAAGGAVEHGDVVIVPRADGADVVGAGPALDDALARLAGAGAEQVDAAAVDARAVAVGEPRWGREVAPPHLPEELGLLPTHVHLAKGCYPGQEAVARMWMLGRPRRRLARVTVDDAVEAGWMTGAGKRAVTVTAVADGHGLAFVPADASVGDRVEDDTGRGVVVRAFVGEGLPVPGHDPAMSRRRDRR